MLAGFGVLWAMPMLFLIAGLGSWHSLRRRGPGGFSVERLLRLGVPLVVATVTIVPVPQWLRLKAADPAYDQSYWRFLGEFFDVHVDLTNFPFVLRGAYFETGHLWFVVLLIAFSLLLAAVVAVVRARAGRLHARPARRVGRRAPGRLALAGAGLRRGHRGARHGGVVRRVAPVGVPPVLPVRLSARLRRAVPRGHAPRRRGRRHPRRRAVPARRPGAAARRRRSVHRHEPGGAGGAGALRRGRLVLGGGDPGAARPPPAPLGRAPTGAVVRVSDRRRAAAVRPAPADRRGRGLLRGALGRPHDRQVPGDRGGVAGPDPAGVRPAGPPHPGEPCPVRPAPDGPRTDS